MTYKEKGHLELWERVQCNHSWWFRCNIIPWMAKITFGSVYWIRSLNILNWFYWMCCHYLRCVCMFVFQCQFTFVCEAILRVYRERFKQSSTPNSWWEERDSRGVFKNRSEWRSSVRLSIKMDENRAGSRGCVWIKMDGQSLLWLWLSWQLCGSRKNIKHFDMYKLIGPHSTHAFSFSVPHTHQLLYLGESHEICQEMFRSHLTPNQRIFFCRNCIE